MILVFVLLLCHVSWACNWQHNEYYDTFTGNPITEAKYKEEVKKNISFFCAIQVEQCDAYEGRRIDATCNNLHRPPRGGVHTPMYTLLPQIFTKVGNEFLPRKSKSGKDLPLCRHLRTSLLSEGSVPSQDFIQLMIHFWLYTAGDIVSIQDSVSFVLWKTYCCTPKGKCDPDCTPNYVPDDDPVFRFSEVRCLNSTRPATYQTSGCVANGTTPQRINGATPEFDLSQLYGNNLNISLERGRKFEGGLLKYEEVDGRIWPPTYPAGTGVCYLNQPPQETRCHFMPQDGGNTLLGINLFTMWFWRHHNVIANQLAALNPCWDDEKLFYTARDINIAAYNQILFYELLPAVMGRDNLIEDGVITPSLGFRDLYDPRYYPQISLEYPYAMRSLHTWQEGMVKMFDTDGAYVKQIPIVNVSMRTGYLAIDDNLDYITQGCFRQGSAKNDKIVDPLISNLGLGALQRACDITTNDLCKGRYFGFQPYIKYRELYTGRKYETFEDLADIMSAESIEILGTLYEHVEDIDFLVGLWLEEEKLGAFVTPTSYYIFVKQMLRNLVSDRHWYERPNRPNAFTYDQLLEIRKVTIAQFLCFVGDKVTHIQPNAFWRAGPGNEMRSCDEIKTISFDPWKDYSCDQQNMDTCRDQ